MKYSMLHSACNPRRRSIKSKIVMCLVILAIVGGLGWLKKRDIDHQDEDVQSYEPTMTMPIDIRSVRT